MLMPSALVVVRDLYIPRRALAPLEAYPPWVIDTDAVLAAPIPVQSFEPIARRYPEIIEPLGSNTLPIWPSAARPLGGTSRL
jgi:hypothetical protein